MNQGRKTNPRANGRESFCAYGSGLFVFRDRILREIHQKERMTASHGIWKPIIKTVQELAEEQEKIILFNPEIHDQQSSIKSPFEAISFKVFQERLDEVLGSLTEREEKVLRLRFGIGDGYPRTLEEVAGVFNVSRFRVRHIEANAIRRMRQRARAGALEEYAVEAGLKALDYSDDTAYGRIAE